MKGQRIMVGRATRTIAGLAVLLMATTAWAQSASEWKPLQLMPEELATRLVRLEENVDRVIANLKAHKPSRADQRESVAVRLGELAESLFEATERAPFLDASDRTMVKKTVKALAAVLGDLRSPRKPGPAIRRLRPAPLAALGAIAVALSDRIRYVRASSHEG